MVNLFCFPRFCFPGVRRFLLVTALLLSLALPVSAREDVTLLRTPGNGLQPQAVVDARGSLHLIYFTGDPAHGDVFYVRKNLVRDTPFSAPIRVNRTPGSVMATGTIRGAQLAVGRNGRVHVTWNGVGAKAANGYPAPYAAYTRLNDSGTAFEPQRNLLAPGEMVDGGGSIAADAQGRVYVTWHMSPSGKDEAAGGAFVAISKDDGRTFSAGRKVSVPATGQCGCCSMRAFVDHTGALYILYRAAGENTNRDTTLLVSRDYGTTFQSAVLSKWKLNACPMSSYSLSEDGSGVLGAWEMAEQVYWGRLDGTRLTAPVAAPGTGSRKYPVVAGSGGRTLFAWVEGAGWQRGGKLHWMVYGKDGTSPKGVQGTQDVPAWSLIAAVTRPDGSFLLLY